MKKPTQLQRILYKMLTECTGRALCDSGDAYGRHWQRNQKRSIQDFMAEPEVKATFDIWKPKDGPARLELEATISVFHFLDRCLGWYEADMTKRFWDWCRKSEDRYPSAPGHFEEWVEKIGGRVQGVVNTYNGEDSLSQTLQYVLFESPDGDDMVGMSVHGGCDVRGGYSNIRVFSIPRMPDHYLSDNARFTLYADNTVDVESPVLAGMGKPEDMDNSHYWDCYDAGYSMDSGESRNGTRIKQLKDYPVTDDPTLKGKGHVYVADGKAYSPINGAELVVGI